MTTETLAAPDDLMTITALADALAQAGDKVDRSTLSRYVNNHGLVVKRQGRSALCSLDQVRRHRLKNYDRELMGGASLGRLDPGAPAPSGEAGSAPGSLTSETPPAQTAAQVEDLDERRREKRAKAIMAELELSRSLGLVVERSEVEAGMAAAVGRFARAAGHSASDATDTFMAELDLPISARPAVKLFFRRFVRDLRESLAAEFRALATELSEGDAAKDADARFDQLSDLARELMPDPLGDRAQPAGQDRSRA